MRITLFFTLVLCLCSICLGEENPIAAQEYISAAKKQIENTNSIRFTIEAISKTKSDMKNFPNSEEKSIVKAVLDLRNHQGTILTQKHRNNKKVFMEDLFAGGISFALRYDERDDKCFIRTPSLQPLPKDKVEQYPRDLFLNSFVPAFWGIWVNADGKFESIWDILSRIGNIELEKKKKI
jgi:hypothetical protein